MSFDDCIVWARKLFAKFYNHRIKQMVHLLPADKKDTRSDMAQA